MIRYNWTLVFALLIASGLAILGILVKQSLLFLPSLFVSAFIVVDIVIRLGRWIDKKLQEPDKNKPWGIR